MLTDLQRRKLRAMFDFYDCNKNGFLQQDDYEAVIARFSELRGWAPGTPEYERMRAGYMAVWDSLRSHADTNRDNRVSFEEMLQYNEALMQTEEGFAREVMTLGQTLFELIDVDGSGRLTVDKLRMLYEGFGIDPELAAPMFAKLDVEGVGQVDQQAAFERVREFYFSDDPEAPGNWLFGPF